MASDNPETFADLDGHGCGLSLDGQGTISCDNYLSISAKPGEGFPPPQKNGTNTPNSTTQQAQQQADQQNRAQYTATILGQDVPVTIVGGTADDRNAIRGRLDAAFADINQHGAALSAAEAEIIKNVKGITVSEEMRTAVNPRTGTYNLKSGYIEGSSTAWLASTIGHEGGARHTISERCRL